jgi:hypothetical protein
MNLENAVVKYIETVQEKVNAYYASSLNNLVPSLIQVDGGRKYIKISTTSDGGQGQKSVHSFIATEDDLKKNLKVGDILMAASWKAPAKHARGNIFGKINLTSTGSVPYLK